MTKIAVSDQHASAAYSVTVLHAEQGKRLTKLYRDPTKAPEDYDGAAFFSAREVTCDSFAEFVESLASIDPTTCIIRGRVRDDARAIVDKGPVRRREHERDGYPGIFEPCERSWIVLDADKTTAPFNPADVEGSVAAWHATLPAELRSAQSAFFLSASAHLKPTVRGKLLVALAEPLDNASAEAFAKAHGFDGSVCRTVQPNYFAAPIFEGCTDPLEGKRAPIVFEGKPARLPPLTATQRKRAQRLGRAEPVPDDLPEPSARVSDLATAFLEPWSAGNRVETNAWLHFCGWALGKGWSKGELGALLRLIDSDESDPAKRAEHWHILGNARSLDGPGRARDWLGEHFDRVDKLINRTSFGERRAVAIDSRAENDTGDVEHDGLVFGTLSSNPPKQTFLVPELEIGVGRPYGWVGKTNASKTLALMQLEVDLALGRPVFGQFAGPGKPVPVLRLAYEGFTKAPEDYLRLLRGTGSKLDFAELNARLRFAEPHRWLGKDETQNREWLLRITEPFSGGVCVIDPLVAACRELDENSTEIAAPIYTLEHVSKANGVAFIVAHHFGHGAERSRGSSAIDGAFGASASIAKVDGNGQRDRRVVQCLKRNRYGFQDFELAIRDTTEQGKPWKPTAEAIRANETSWAVCVETTLKTSPDAKELEAARALAEKVAALEAMVRDSAGGLSARAVRTALGLSGERFPAVLAAAKARGHVRQKEAWGDASKAVVLEWDETAQPKQPRRFGKFVVAG